MPTLNEKPKVKLTLRRVRLNSGGYEYGRRGKYWGIGEPLYQYFPDSDSDAQIEGHLRASNREDAKEKLWKQYPGFDLRFYN